MKQRTCTVQLLNGRAWARLSSSRAPGIAPIHEVLRFIVEQINFGNVDCTCDQSGMVTDFVIGAAASPPFDDRMVDGVREAVQERALAVNVAGLFAKAREEGIEPQYVQLVARANVTATQAARDNTDLHYALELIAILERVSQLGFVFDAPPVKSRAGADVVALLREATKAYLYGMTRGSVSLCRALLEAALKEKVPQAELIAERQRANKGELECMIIVAARRGLLTNAVVVKAHAVRKAGNRALHRTPPDDKVAWSVLLDTRGVVSALYA
jgi:hypothetical protein